MECCCILVEHAQDKIKPVSYELVTAARKLATLKSIHTTAIIMGAGVNSLAEEFSASTGLETIALQVPQLQGSHTEIAKAALLELFSESAPHYLIACHSTRTLDLAPALAVRLRAGCITAVEDFTWMNERLTFKRSICGGKLVTHMMCHSETVILTIQPGSFKKLEPVAKADPKVVKKEYDINPKRLTYLSTRESGADVSALKEAKTIVAAGRGIEDEENLKMIRDFAALFERSAVAGSRPLCDIGWLEYNQQVGITGATVNPDLYIACGISGTYQHTIGMKGAGYIIAINKDTNSPFFNMADLCIVEDVTTFIPLVLEEYRNLKREEK